MNDIKSLRAHWNNIYSTKKDSEVSWTQKSPETSLKIINTLPISKDAAIIDIGGGESKLVDYLLQGGFTNVTVLDISEEALKKVRQRLGRKSDTVKWIVSDIFEFTPPNQYAVWHDRATFHFMTTDEQVKQYVALAAGSLTDNGFLAVATFSEFGPDKCSGLSVEKYSEDKLEETLYRFFKKIRCFTEDHITPFLTKQSFMFCSFSKRVDSEATA